MTKESLAGITVLDQHECWALLKAEEVGRLAVAVDHHPDIFPINYAVDGTSLVFRTAEGAKLAAAFIGPGLAFEIDGYDADAGDAWSVVVKGHAQEIDMHDLLDEGAFPLFPWSAHPKARFVRVVPDEVTGRRFHVVRHQPTENG